jgi:hypothetical protein
MARRKKDPSRKTTYKPLKRGAFARSLATLANQVDAEGNNLNLLELQKGKYRNTPSQIPSDIQRCFVPKDVLDDERTFKAS